MKIRSILWLSTFSLLGATLASAGTPAPAASSAVASPVSVAAAAPPFCTAGLQKEALPLTPSPSAKAGNCGECSPSPCQGLNINASCYYLTRTGYAIGKCHADSVCTESGFSTACFCRNGPEV
jgi:hypothetical protein